MRVLMTGTDGYLGSVIAADLLTKGWDVTGVDTGYYRTGWLYNGLDRVPTTLTKDIRHLERADLEGFDAIVHMAELSNDPTGDLAPTITYEINHGGSVHLAGLAREVGIERFVYMSSCSVYGVAEGTVDESSPVNPQTAYAECKTMVERDLSAMAGDDFSPCYLRNATAFGASPRMRFDVVANNLAGLAWTTGEIAMTSDGTPWRPLVHALDIGRAVECAVAAPREAIHDEVFNVGATAHNYQVREIAERVAEEFTGCALSFGPPSADNRSYRVNFDKIATQLPGFEATWPLERGLAQLHSVFEAIDMSAEIFRYPAFTRLARLKELIASSQIDASFFWTYGADAPTPVA